MVLRDFLLYYVFLNMSNIFFDEQQQQSLVKSTITAKYFDVWAGIITNTQNNNASSGRQTEDRIAYIDLFAGPGRYKDGSMSTPLRILENAIRNETYRKRLVTWFNDVDSNNTQTLQEAIDTLPNIDTVIIEEKNSITSPISNN